MSSWKHEKLIQNNPKGSIIFAWGTSRKASESFFIISVRRKRMSFSCKKGNYFAEFKKDFVHRLELNHSLHPVSELIWLQCVMLKEAESALQWAVSNHASSLVWPNFKNRITQKGLFNIVNLSTIWFERSRPWQFLVQSTQCRFSENVLNLIQNTSLLADKMRFNKVNIRHVDDSFLARIWITS